MITWSTTKQQHQQSMLPSQGNFSDSSKWVFINATILHRFQMVLDPLSEATLNSPDMTFKEFFTENYYLKLVVDQLQFTDYHGNVRQVKKYIV